MSGKSEGLKKARMTGLQRARENTAKGRTRELRRGQSKHSSGG